MKRLETVLFPAADADYLSLRWVRGSGLQGRGDHLDNLRLRLTAEPGYGIRFVSKAGYCLVLGDAGSRTYRWKTQASASTRGCSMPADRRQEPELALAAPSPPPSPPPPRCATWPSTTASIRPSSAPQGGLRGRLRTAPNSYLPWALISATGQQDGTSYHFVAQADDKGEFTLDLTGLPHPDPGPLTLTLSLRAAADLDADRTPDPDAFGDYRISADGTADGLQASIDVQIAAFGETLKLGELLVAPPG